MDMKEYISEVVKMGPIPEGIDRAHEIFLEWILKGHTSAYKIYLVHKNSVYRPIAYKNVHRRIKRLFQANFIEDVKVEGGFKHGARNYKLTTRGLVYIFREELSIGDINSILLKYPDDVLFKALLYPYFEKRTIKLATYSLLSLIGDYIAECCQITRYFLDRLMEYTRIRDDNTIAPDEIGLYIPLQMLYLQLNWHIKSFLFRVAAMKEDHTDWRGSVTELPVPPGDPVLALRKIRCTANDRMQTYELLSEDKKFMHALKDVESDFREGYQKLLEIKKIRV
jgi:hypothetical protein